MSYSLIVEEQDEDLNELTQELLSSSDSESEEIKHGGSSVGRAPNIDRERQRGHQQLYKDYLANNSVYTEVHFRRIFRISRNLFQTINEKFGTQYHYFVQRPDCRGIQGFSTEQKVTAALRLLAYGCAADSVDEYVHMAQSTAAESLTNFCQCMIAGFGEEFLRVPNATDIACILRRNSHRGFPGLIGSIDCTKWLWKNCPLAWRGQYQGKERKPAVALKAIADDKLWIWHAFFGTPGSENDINVLETSPLLSKIANGSFPSKVSYLLNGKKREVPYFLCDGVYPRYPLFVHTVHEAVTKKKKLLAKWQEGRRKDVERAFRVLHARWHILCRPSRFWTVRSMRNVLYCCIILHNMMVEEGLSEEDIMLPDSTEIQEGEVVHFGHPVWADDNFHGLEGTIAGLCQGEEFLRDEEKQRSLQHDVIEHLWSLHANT